LKIYDEKRQKKFNVDHLFLTIYSQVKLKLVAKVEFAKNNAKYEGPIIDSGNNMDGGPMNNTRRVKTQEKFTIAQLNRDILNEDISKFETKKHYVNVKLIEKGRIFMKRREKMLKLCGGVSKIKTNIKTVMDFRPEKKVVDRNLKRVNEK